jgi:hypothetical protein
MNKEMLTFGRRYKFLGERKKEDTKLRILLLFFSPCSPPCTTLAKRSRDTKKRALNAGNMATAFVWACFGLDDWVWFRARGRGERRALDYGYSTHVTNFLLLASPFWVLSVRFLISHVDDDTMMVEMSLLVSVLFYNIIYPLLLLFQGGGVLT